MTSDKLIMFKEESEEVTQTKIDERLKILTVDDDASFRHSMSFALSNLKVFGKHLHLIQARSFAEASKLLAEHPDIAIALVDVVMETDDAGLRLVKAVREILGNAEMRIILVTGQPGMAPMVDMMSGYDINDYWAKADLSHDRLQTILTANARSFEQIREIARAKRGLQCIAEASGALYSARNLADISTKMLDQLAKLLDVSPQGIVCAKNQKKSSAQASTVITSASKAYSSSVGKTLSDLSEPKVAALLIKCLTDRESYFHSDYTCLYFSGELGGSDYAVYLATGRTLDSTEMELLRVFNANICGGLVNVALVSQLDKIAYEDELLKMPNRNSLLRSLDFMLASSYRASYQLLLVDIDNFSGINTVLGPNQGDEVLFYVASKLRALLDPAVIIARIRGDVFAVLGYCDLFNHADIVELFQGGRTDGGKCHTVNISTLLLTLDQVSGSALDVLTRAGIALKAAKLKGIKQHVIYSPHNNLDEEYRFNLLQQLQSCLSNGGISIMLQPQASLATGTLNGVEVLARWQLPDGHYVPPNEFIPLAETTGLIVSLGEQILTHACEAAGILAANGHTGLRVSINLSAVQLEHENTLPLILELVENNHLKPEQLEFEVTETVTMQNYSIASKFLDELRKRKFHIAIDDFGTGFSSLAYLGKFPADRLKIDKSFVDNVTTSNSAAAIARAVIQLGRQFNMNVIAEGVETLAQSDWLRSNGCDDLQGYLLAKPLPLADLLTWLNHYEPVVDR